MTRFPAAAIGAAATAVIAIAAVSATGVMPALAGARSAPHRVADRAAHGAVTTALTTATGKAHPATAEKARKPPKTEKATSKDHRGKAADPVRIVTQYASGTYVTVVTCTGAHVPPPIHIGAPGTPLTAHGTGPSAGVLRTLSKPKGYTTVYTCTVVVKKRVPAVTAKRVCEIPGSASGSGSSSGRTGVCRRTVTISTGFGGKAPSVARHHPAR